MAVDKKQFAGGDGKFLAIQAAGGINTRDPRQSIKDEQFSWLENIHPLGDGNFRALYSNGTALYTTSNPRTIVYHYPFNIGATNYIAVFLDDGTAVAVNSDTGATTTITSTQASFYPGDPNLGTPLPQCSQYGEQGIVIVSTGIHGYSFWDGSLFYTDGTLAPGITITDQGSAYQTTPSVLISGGSGTGATAVATINNGVVSAITITNPGSGWKVGDAAPTVTITGGTVTGSGAALTAVLSSTGGGTGAVLTPNFSTSGFYRIISTITVSNGGSGYSNNATATWVQTGLPGNWPYGKPTIVLTIVGGVITAATLKGSTPKYWFANGGGDPTITVSDPSSRFAVTSVTVTNGGTNYSPTTTVTGSGGGSPITQATFSPVINSSGVITSVTVETAGLYGSNTPPTLTVTDTATNATATASLMPFGISGTCVETYQSRVWVGNGPNIFFTAAGLANDFDPADGAGAFQSNDAFLRREFTALKQSSSFLYLFADSSINVISNVQETGSPTLVTFNNQNVDPRIGTPWHNSVLELNGDLIFANTIGVFRLRGGRVQKISDELDGIFQAANTTLLADDATTQPSCAVMTINNELVYMLVLPVKGPLDSVARTGLVMWNGQRWWVGSQDQTFTQVAMQEINSVLQAWGNTTTTIRKMFNTASGTLTKLWQGKLWAGEGPHTTKQAMRLFTMALDKSTGGYTFTGTIDYQLEGTAVLTQAVTVNQTNLTGVGSNSANVRGNYVGLTLHTTKDDFVLLANALLYQEQSPLGG